MSILHVLTHICKDVELAYPTLSIGLGRDISRLTLLVENRGLGVFTLDLPLLESKLLLGLEQGLLPSSGYRKVSKKCRVPRLFSGLWLRIFDENLMLRSEADVNAIAFLRQLLLLGKKTDVPCSTERSAQAVKEYIHVERTLPVPTLKWDLDDLDPDGDGSRLHLCDALVTDLPLFPDKSENRRSDRILLARCQRVADYFARTLGSFDPYSIIERNRVDGSALGVKHGPGAVAERTGLFDKNDFIRWPVKLERIFPFNDFGRMPNDTYEPPQIGEAPSRLCLVPKTAKGPRIIAAEPTEHLWCQFLVKSQLDFIIRESFIGKSIDFRRQDLSGQLVKKASLDRKLATIDLSSASDRLTCWLVERIFRFNPEFLHTIHACRTRYISIDVKGVDKTSLILRKYASQGTALTFPIQSLVFLIICVAALMQDSNFSGSDIERVARKVRVYGDDLILPTYGYEKVVALLHLLHLKVNTEKSFHSGYFRESCGSDFYKGYDVTPVKPSTTLSGGPASCKAVLDTSNNLFYKGYWHASDYLMRRLNRDNRYRFPLVGRDAVADGFVTHSYTRAVRKTLSLVGFGNHRSHRNRRILSTIHRALGLPSYKARWNTKLQRVEYRRRAFCSKTVTEGKSRGYSALLGFAISKPREEITSEQSLHDQLALRHRLLTDAVWGPIEDFFLW